MIQLPHQETGLEGSPHPKSNISSLTPLVTQQLSFSYICLQPHSREFLEAALAIFFTTNCTAELCHSLRKMCLETSPDLKDYLTSDRYPKRTRTKDRVPIYLSKGVESIFAESK